MVEHNLGHNHKLIEDAKNTEFFVLLCPRWGRVGFVPKNRITYERVCICGYTSHGPVKLEKVNGST